MPRRNSIVPTTNRVIQLLNEWLERCNLVNFNKHDSILRYFDVNTNDEELINCIITALEDESYHEKYLEEICQKLFLFYRTKLDKYRLLVFNCLPSLTYLHLTKSIKNWNFFQPSSLSDQQSSPVSTKSSISSNLNEKLTDKHAANNIYTSVDTLLLSIYNMEVLNENGLPVIKNFKVPLLSRPSIYHESSHLSIGDFNPSQIEIITTFGPYYEFEQINSSNRMQILTILFEIYNQHLTSLVIESLISICNLCINVLEQDTRNQNLKANNQIQTFNNNLNEFEGNLIKNLIYLNQTRINLSSKLIIQFLTSIYFCLFNGVVDLGRKSLKLIHNKSIEMMYLDVLLMTNSIINSTSSIQSITKSDDLMGINVILSPTIKSQTSKKAITNANFRTQLLPEDIPIVTKQMSDKK